MSSPLNKLNILYDKHFDSMLAYGLSLGVSEQTVEDAIHDVFVNIHKVLSSHKSNLYDLDDDSLRFFLLRCLKNRIVSIQRLRDNQLSQLSDDIFADDQVVSYGPEYESMLLELENAIPLLNDHQRQAIQLRFYSNLSFKEIAKRLGINTKGAQKLVYRSLEKLRSKIKH